MSALQAIRVFGAGAPMAAVGFKTSVMRGLAQSHLHVMRLMMCADGQDTKEPRAKDTGNILVGLDPDAHGCPIR